MLIRLRSTGQVISGDAFKVLHPNISIALPLDVQMADFFAADNVTETPRPTDTSTQTSVLSPTAALVNGVWVTIWTMVDKDAATLAAEALAAKDIVDTTAVKADSTVQYLVTHTPAECANLVHTTVNSAAIATLADAKTAMVRHEEITARLASALSVALRDKFR